MKGKEFFNNLKGNWVINRYIFNKSQDPFKLSASNGTATASSLENSKLKYCETFSVKYNDKTFAAQKEYEYVLGNDEILSLHNRIRDIPLFMFNILFEKQNVGEGQYNCLNDHYKATYRIINENSFTLRFEVKGPTKDYTVLSLFFREEEAPLLETAGDTANNDDLLK